MGMTLTGIGYCVTYWRNSQVERENDNYFCYCNLYNVYFLQSLSHVTYKRLVSV